MNVEFLLFISFGIFYIVLQDQIAFLDVLKNAGDKYRAGWEWVRSNFAKIISDEVQIEPAWTTHSLILLNCAAFVYAISLGYEQILSDFAFVPAMADQYWRWLTHQFLHASTPSLAAPFSAHLLGNMVYLYVFGDNVEDVFKHLAGRIETTVNLYVLFYLAGGVVAAAVQATAVGWNSTALMIGASGSISAVLGAYAVLFPRNMVKAGGVNIMPAMVFFIAWFSSQILGNDPTIAASAHVGGFIYGAAVGAVLRKITR